MTLPYEERDAIIWTESFMMELIDPKKTPRVPSEIRRRAYRLLRHFPCKSRIRRLYEVDENDRDVSELILLSRQALENFEDDIENKPMRHSCGRLIAMLKHALAKADTKKEQEAKGAHG